jgi:hypothetical protein
MIQNQSRNEERSQSWLRTKQATHRSLGRFLNSERGNDVETGFFRPGQGTFT